MSCEMTTQKHQKWADKTVHTTNIIRQVMGGTESCSQRRNPWHKTDGANETTSYCTVEIFAIVIICIEAHNALIKRLPVL